MANYFTAGIKGRWLEERRDDDHRLTDEAVLVDAVVDGRVGQREVAALVGLNTDLRREYITDCTSGTTRWNRILREAGIDRELRLPSVAFNRQVGAFAGIRTTPDGEVVPEEIWERDQGKWLPTEVDKTYVRSLMQPVHERGRIAAWIAPPRQGINGRSFDYDYVHLA